VIKTLLVDDEPWTREVIKQFGRWEQFGMQIVGEADNGLKAIEMIRLHQPHLVITDMRMPGVDGVQLLQYLDEHFGGIKVIVISGYDDFVYTRQAIRSKVHEYLLKPIDPQELNTALNKCREEIAARLACLTPGALDRETIGGIDSAAKRIAALLLEGEREALRAAFEDLYRKFRHLEHSRALIHRVYHELWKLWEETVVLHGLEIRETDSRYDPASATWRATVEVLQALYEQAFDKLQEDRKYRHKINLRDVRLFIERHYTEPITLDSIARRFFVSKEYLSRAFKRETGWNVSDFILRLRMERAKALLTEDRLPIKAVAGLVGYEDVAYFYRLFKKHFGVTPGEIRKAGGQVSKVQ
jgi:two-component system response regulator YesN